MKLETLFLRIAVFLFGLPVILLSIFWLPGLANIAAIMNPKLAYLLLTGLYATLIPFFFTLYQTIILLNYIDQSQALTEQSIKPIKNIKISAIAISILYVVIMPVLYIIAEIDDAPGIIVIGMVMIFASTVIAVFADILQKLLINVIHIKP